MTAQNFLPKFIVYCKCDDCATRVTYAFVSALITYFSFPFFKAWKDVAPAESGLVDKNHYMYVIMLFMRYNHHLITSLLVG